jgi:hypothetical protein
MHQLTSSPEPNMGARTYSDTVARGLYDRPVGGLRGKYDNVLQRLECTLQEGLGCGHGLLAVLRIGAPG